MEEYRLSLTRAGETRLSIFARKSSSFNRFEKEFKILQNLVMLLPEKKLV